jgi:hypothetical protein
MKTAPHEPETGGWRVDVRILKPGKHQPAIEVHNIGGWLDPLRQLAVIGRNGHDFAVVDNHPRRPTASGIDRENDPIPQHQFGQAHLLGAG